MKRFLFDLIFDDLEQIHTNELIALDVDHAIDFIDNYFMELHGEGSPGPSAIALRLPGENEPLLHYTLHLDAVGSET